MERRSFSDFLKQIAQLSQQQREALLQAVHAVDGAAHAAHLIEAARAPMLACPRCNGNRFHRHGHANGLQRWRCRACGRTFNALTSTPLARLRHKHKWLAYCDTLLDPAATVRRAATQVEVHRNTSFRWRHRMLAWLKNDRPPSLGGIVEADEMYVLESQKGSRALCRPARKRGGDASRRGISREQVCVLVARDRTGATHDFVTGMGPITKQQLHRHLAPVIAQGSLLVTDGNAAYRAFAREAAIAHAAVNLQQGERVRGTVHVQNVNAYHSRMRRWLHHFCGVATRYLANYCGWRWAIDGERIDNPASLLRRAVGLFNT